MFWQILAPISRLHLVAQWLETLLRSTIVWTVMISVLSILWPENSVISNTQVKLQISFIINGITIKTMLESLTGTSPACRDTYINIFRGRVTKASWMRRQLHLLIKQMEKIRKIGKDFGYEHGKQWNLTGLILHIVYSRLILYFACLFIYYYFQSTITFIAYYFYSSLDLLIHLFIVIIIILFIYLFFFHYLVTIYN